GCQSNPFIDCAGPGRQHFSVIDQPPAPPSHRAILAHEEEDVSVKASYIVKNLSGRVSFTWNDDLQCLLGYMNRACCIVCYHIQSGQPCAIITDPERTSRAE